MLVVFYRHSAYYTIVEGPQVEALPCLFWIPHLIQGLTVEDNDYGGGEGLSREHYNKQLV